MAVRRKTEGTEYRRGWNDAIERAALVAEAWDHRGDIAKAIRKLAHKSDSGTTT